ncbi:MAG TPA: hypothetical protein VE549_14415 [Myxococcaceae bacterium]|nr:hypothetical protein [Myxococcaceae bacterium]
MALPLLLAPLVTQALPMILPQLVGALAGPAGQAAQGLLGQLATSLFSPQAKKEGLFPEKTPLGLPNPLALLNGHFKELGKLYSRAGDLLKGLGDFLQGKPTKLENGKEITKPHVLDPKTAKIHFDAAGAIINQINVNVHVNQGGVSTEPATSAGKTGKSKSASGSLTVGGVQLDKGAFSSALSPEQNRILSEVKDPTQKAQMKAQMEMQNMQNLMQFLSNITRIMGDISKAIVQNVRS